MENAGRLNDKHLIFNIDYMTKTTLDLEAQSPDFSLEMDSTFRECRHKYNTMIGGVSGDFIGNLYWGLGSLASRNKYYSPLINRCIKLFLVRNRLISNSIPDTIRTRDRELCDVLENNFRRAFPNVKFECTETNSERIRRITRPLRQYLISIVLLFLRFLSSRNCDKQVEQIKNSRVPIVLLDTFVLNNNGDEGGIADGVYKDRYYPGLLDKLTDAQKIAVWYVPTTVGFFNFFSIYKKIRAAKPKLLLIDDYIKSSDYLFALTFPFKYIRIPIPTVKLDGMDITHMVRHEQVNKSCDYMSIQSLLHYRFSRRLRERGVLVDSYIDWNENQTIDRAMIKGFRDHYDDTRIIGYQGYIISKELHLYCFPTEYEVLSGFSPDTMYVVGAGLVDDMKEFTNRMDVQVGPAFRFASVWRTPKYQTDSEAFGVLIGLPISLPEAMHITQLVRAATKNFSTEYGYFRIKPHPTYSIEAIRSLIGVHESGNIEFVSGDFHDTIEKSDLLISNSSSVCLESLAKGVPVIVIGSASGVTQNPIPPDLAPEMWHLVHDSVELSALIQTFRTSSSANKEMLRATGRKIRASYFNPVTVESVQNFVFRDRSVE